MKRVACCLIVLFVMGFVKQAAGQSTEVTLTVSHDGPIASLKQAVEEVRKLPKADRPIIVEFQTGTYTLTEPVVFNSDDSGTEKSPILYRAKSGEHVVFSGGKKITGWRKSGKTRSGHDIWVTNIPDVAEGRWQFDQLYIGGNRATRCRTPNTEYFYTAEPVDMAIDPATGQTENMASRAFVATDNDLDILKSVPTDQLRDVVVTMYHSWESSAHRIAAVDFDTNTVVFTGPARWPLMQWEPRQRYHIENCKAALDAPGEWFLDHDGTLSYIAKPGENLDQLDVIAPVADAFLRFEGNTAKDATGGHIEHIAFENLKFHYSGFVLEPEGHSDSQSAINMPFAVKLDGCRNVSFENCEFAHIGGSAVRFHRACTDCRFVKNYVHDLGAGAVYIGQAWEPNLDQAQPSERNLVENCVIRNGGQFDMGGIGVWIGHGSHNKVLHNDISEFYYTGVSVGWQWGYQPSRSHHNQIEFNHIHHLGHWILSDMGGVYSLGVSPGTTVSNNVMHDIYAYSYGGWGLYTDEGSTGIVLENNLVYRVKTGTFHQHYGKENIVRNNILAYSLTDQVQRSRIEEHISFFLENNIIIWDDGAVLFGHPWTKDSLGQWGDDKVAIKNNLYWSADADMSKAFPSRDGSGNDLQTWRELTNHDEGSIIADPMFRDPKNGDFTLPDDSPAFKTGFKRFDYSKAGVYGDAVWVKLASAYDHPIRPVAPEKPKPLPLKINDDFESPRTHPMLKAQINNENKADLVRISTDRPAAGARCLEIADSAELQHGFNPHVVLMPAYEQGKVRFAFDLRTQKNAYPFVELRDNSNPYKTGPSLRIHDGKLHIRGIEPIDFPLDQWVRFEIVTTLGEQPDRTWALRLTFPDGTQKTQKDLPLMQSDWQTLNWVGFCNLSQIGDDASFFLDNVLLDNNDN